MADGDEAGGAVLVRDEGRCRWLTLNRPGRLNAFDAALASTLLRKLQDAVGDPTCGVVVLTGAGRAFSAGQDLSERRDVPINPIDLGEALARNWHPLLTLVRESAKPIVAAINGLVSGAGVNLVAACDIVIAARGVTFTQPFVRLGIMPDCGGPYLLPRLMGPARARGMTLLAEPIDAETAERFGLIWRVVEPEDLVLQTSAVAQRLLDAAPLALAATKKALREAEHVSFDEALAQERSAQRTLGYSKDYAEGITAFFEKRPPKFTGQ
jgi:2-(1,2-epoxy-1,2-dihydrophenyl)acetyl-CoA isomerase